MTSVNINQPDVTLQMNMDGVIEEVVLSSILAGEGVDDWIGRPWFETVTDVGGDKVRRMVADARQGNVAGFRQLTQRFPSGLELLMEYTTVLGRSGLIAVGKSLQAVADLQSRLIAAQQALERDYWKLREVETRYRLLFDTSNDAVLLLKASTLRIDEANPAALRALGQPPQRPDRVAGREFVSEVAGPEREALHAMLERAREQGKAPGIIVHLGSLREPWLVRASLITAETGMLFLLQLTPAGGQRGGERPAVSVEQLIERGPEPFVVVDGLGIVVLANGAFLDLAEVDADQQAVGKPLSHWLTGGDADVSRLLAGVRQQGRVSAFAARIRGERGAETAVEVSAAGDADMQPSYVGLLLHRPAPLRNGER